jgi:hypothetical protein
MESAMSAKNEIEKHPVLLNVARSLHYQRPGVTLADLKKELEAALVVVRGLIAEHGESALLSERGQTRRRTTK